MKDIDAAQVLSLRSLVTSLSPSSLTASLLEHTCGEDEEKREKNKSMSGGSVILSYSISLYWPNFIRFIGQYTMKLEKKESERTAA